MRSGETPDGVDRPQLVGYALALAGQLERYPQTPDRVSWRDSQIHEAVLAARAEMQQDRIEETKRSARNKP